MIFKDNSVFSLKSKSSAIKIYGDILFQNMIINADCIIDSDISVNGDIEFLSGIVDIDDNTLILNGNLIREREDSHVFSSSTGEIIVKKNLASSMQVSPGNLGLELVLDNHSGELEIKRTNQEINSDGKRSILRSYSLAPAVDISNIEFSYFDKEINNLDENDFFVWIEDNSYWNPLKSISSVSNKILTGEAKNVSNITVFSTSINIGVDFPTGFTPNDDGVNDYYVIDGIEKYPNNEFIVFNQWGGVVYKSAPYQNDWNGFSTSNTSLSGDDKLLDGTYFYFFFKDRTNNKSKVQGYFEIRIK